MASMAVARIVANRRGFDGCVCLAVGGRQRSSFSTSFILGVRARVSNPGRSTLTTFNAGA